ncbi:MAG: Hsp70 family protein [Acidimicrobiaceae bacterium]|nr:Hsp70 family protein [Acidimicrobiaceae bacterium]MCO5330777.1 Hsp70 family protein [Ilumatobacteraceae bacterium]
MSWTIGIDFGTSRSAGAVGELDPRRLAADHAGRKVAPIMAPSVAPLEIEGNRWIPSMVLLTPDGQLTVGAAADNLAGVHPDRLERTPKRSLGTPAPLLLGGQPVDARDAAAAVIRTIVAEGRLRHGEAPSGCIITHPVRWAGVRRKALVEAAQRAGLEKVELVDEPVAAAIHYASEHVEMGAHVGVYDLGGGTFDTALLQRTAGGFEVVGVPGGDENIGGEDFDHRLFRYFGQCLAEVDEELWDQMMTSEDRKWKRAALDLLVQARRAKEALSSYTSTQVFVPVADRDIVVNRSQFEAMIIDDVERTVDLMEETILDAGMKVDDLAAIFLVGGSSRVPLVGQLVTERFGARVITRDEPKGVVALGAARLAALRFLMPRPGPAGGGPAPQPPGTPADTPVPSPLPVGDPPPPDAATAVMGIAPPPAAPAPAAGGNWLENLPLPKAHERLGNDPTGPVPMVTPTTPASAAPPSLAAAPPPTVPPSLAAAPPPTVPPSLAAAPPPTVPPSLAAAPPPSVPPAAIAPPPVQPVTVAWHVPLADAPGQLAADATAVVAAGLAGVVRLIDPANGQVRWQASLGAPGWAAPALASDGVVHGSNDGRVIHLDRGTGAVRWQASLGAPVISTPAVAGPMIVAGHDGAKAVGIDRASGALRWELPVGAAVRAGLVAVGSEVAICTTAGQVYMANAATGQVRWGYRTSGQIVLTPAVAATHLLVAAADGVLHGVRLADGAGTWTIRLGGAPAGPVAVAGDLAAVVDDTGVLRVLRADSGAVVAEVPLGGQPAGAVLHPATTATTAVVETGGSLVAVDIATRQTRFSVPTGGGNRCQPVAAGGLVCVATTFNQIFGIVPT